jgi:hypothetical protein
MGGSPARERDLPRGLEDRLLAGSPADGRRPRRRDGQQRPSAQGLPSGVSVELPGYRAYVARTRSRLKLSKDPAFEQKLADIVGDRPLGQSPRERPAANPEEGTSYPSAASA